jgi:hypothetical protein
MCPDCKVKLEKKITFYTKLKEDYYLCPKCKREFDVKEVEDNNYEN